MIRMMLGSGLEALLVLRHQLATLMVTRQGGGKLPVRSTTTQAQRPDAAIAQSFVSKLASTLLTTGRCRRRCRHSLRLNQRRGELHLIVLKLLVRGGADHVEHAAHALIVAWPNKGGPIVRASRRLHNKARRLRRRRFGRLLEEVNFLDRRLRWAASRAASGVMVGVGVAEGAHWWAWAQRAAAASARASATSGSTAVASVVLTK